MNRHHKLAEGSMNTDNIKHLSHNAARLLLVLQACGGSERIADVSRLVTPAGLTLRQYSNAYKQLTKLGFLAYENGSICLLTHEPEIPMVEHYVHPPNNEHRLQR